MFPRITSLTALALALCVPLLDANASFPPKSFKASRAEMTRACEALGENVSYDAWTYKPGEYGCVDLRTGNVVICKDDGTCKLYFGARPRKPFIRMTV
jgi:hypothetical protein